MNIMKLQKAIQAAGFDSRRNIRQAINDGEFKVNNQVVTDPNLLVDLAKDSIRYNDKKLKLKIEKKAYYLFHKPDSVVSTLSDPEGRPTIADFLTGIRERVYPVGRLDYHSEGLILLTNDGDLANFIISPRNCIPKVYTLKIKGVLSKEERENYLSEGVIVDGQRVKPLQLEYIKRTAQDNSWIRVTIIEGKKHIVRKMFLYSGHPVEKLKRVSIGTFQLKTLPRGHWREMLPEELELFRRKFHELPPRQDIEPKRPRRRKYTPREHPRKRSSEFSERPRRRNNESQELPQKRDSELTERPRRRDNESRKFTRKRDSEFSERPRRWDNESRELPRKRDSELTERPRSRDNESQVFTRKRDSEFSEKPRRRDNESRELPRKRDSELTERPRSRDNESQVFTRKRDSELTERPRRRDNESRELPRKRGSELTERPRSRDNESRVFTRKRDSEFSERPRRREDESREFPRRRESNIREYSPSQGKEARERPRRSSFNESRRPRPGTSAPRERTRRRND